MYNYNIENLYLEIYEEGWKAKAAGLGAAALGAASLWPIPDKPEVMIKSPRNNTEYKAEINSEVLDLMKNDKMLQNLIQKYFKSQGKNVQVDIIGDTIKVSSDKGSKEVSKQSMMLAVDKAYNNGDTHKLSGFIANNL